MRHYASNVVESASDSVPVPASDRLRPNIPPLQFAAHEFLPEVAASAAVVAQYRQLRVRRALGVLPSSLILVPGAVSQRRGNHPPAPSGLQGGPIAAPFSIASGGDSASGSGGENRSISGVISGDGRADSGVGGESSGQGGGDIAGSVGRAEARGQYTGDVAAVSWDAQAFLAQILACMRRESVLLLR